MIALDELGITLRWRFRKGRPGSYSDSMPGEILCDLGGKLTTGVIDAAMISRNEDHRVVDTPYLNIIYESYDRMPLRPRGERPVGACLDPAAPDLPA